ncbi:MAG: chorismate synthase [Elusimicrobia bacterium]|nr:chorismate synthase [Elusimicrobiota bacterium]MBU2615031.1 chorismate synthase [Elusimicrobiota bacterium]
MLRFMTAGESHGKCLTSILEGLPAGLKITQEYINSELERRQKGYGRGDRMKIESDEAQILSGVRWGKTTGTPISLQIENRDWKNWEKVMSLNQEDRSKNVFITKPRPGHSDLPGVLKFNLEDVRDIKERASARETASRVAVGSVCKKFLLEFGIKFFSVVEEIGGIVSMGKLSEIEKRYSAIEGSPLRCADINAEKKMIKLIDNAKSKGDTLGGKFKVVVKNLIPGLGNYIQWDKRLDGRLALALMSIQAVKGVELGSGFGFSKLLGSQAHDEIGYSNKNFFHKTNNSGGIDGGMTNGEDIVLTAVMKPIPTLMKPLKSIDIASKKIVKAEIVRSDVCAVPACAVVAESMAAFEIANTLLEKFGGDSIPETKTNFENYKKQLRNF